jgi:CDP-L-myo-inositol myo-inositolphosphotransferase
MSDHLFDSKVLVELLRQEVGDGCLLAVDRNLEICDLSEATKVKTTDGKIVSIGKNIPEYDAIDTGIFLCTPTIFDAIEKVVSQKRDTLSDAVDLLARRGKASTIDISGFWIDVDTPSDLKLARKIVSQRSVKPTNGVISRYINRRFSTQIFTPLILKVYKEVTPNQASLLSFIVGVISALFFFLLRPVMGGFFVQLASILDGCDGEIARYKNMHSNLGDFIDAVLDRYADSFILLGMFYFSLVTIGNKEVFGIYWTPLLIIGISVLAILGNLMVSYSSAKSIASLNYRYEGRWIATGRGRDLRLFLLFLGGVLSFFHPISVFFALLIIALQTNLIVIWRIILSWKIFRDEE